MVLFHGVGSVIPPRAELEFSYRPLPAGLFIQNYLSP
jgi:hypothetical protein